MYYDPCRLVEGDIFRMGMHLEDIKEIIDNNACEQMPTSTKEMLCVKPLCMSMPSLPPSLHKVTKALAPAQLISFSLTTQIHRAF